MTEYFYIITVISITGGGIVTGLLFAFSNFVMRALDDLQPEHGMFAMQRINEKIINPIFLILFLGTPLLCLAIVIATATILNNPGNILIVRRRDKLLDRTVRDHHAIQCPAKQ